MRTKGYLTTLFLVLLSISTAQAYAQEQEQEGQKQPDIAVQNCDPPTRISEDGRFTFQWCEDGGNLVDTKLNQRAYVFPGEKLQLCAPDGMCVFVDNSERPPPTN